MAAGQHELERQASPLDRARQLKDGTVYRAPQLPECAGKCDQRSTNMDWIAVTKSKVMDLEGQVVGPVVGGFFEPCSGLSLGLDAVDADKVMGRREAHETVWVGRSGGGNGLKV